MKQPTPLAMQDHVERNTRKIGQSEDVSREKSIYSAIKNCNAT
jgi:hypothetical protein